MVHDGQWAWVMTLPVGLMFYGIYTQRFAWMSRLVFGIFFGLAAGTIFQDFSQSLHAPGDAVVRARTSPWFRLPPLRAIPTPPFTPSRSC